MEIERSVSSVLKLNSEGVCSSHGRQISCMGAWAQPDNRRDQRSNKLRLGATLPQLKKMQA